MGEIIVIGLLFAIVFYELTDISPGGIIVPGMLAYYLYDPQRIILTLLVSFIAYALVWLFSQHAFIYGRRKFAVHIIVAVIVAYLLSITVRSWTLHWMDIPMIGTIIAGIIANEVSKQGVVKTYVSLIFIVLLTGMVAWLL